MSDAPNFLAINLPEPMSEEDIYGQLLVVPEFRDAERRLSHLHRRRIVARRLSNFFNPGSRQVVQFTDLVEQIRNGYEGRGRTMADHERRIREVAALHKEGTLVPGKGEMDARFTMKPVGLNNTARSSILLGTPGMGKSLTVEEILRRIPEVVSHRSGMQLEQVCWIKLDCPHRSSVKSLCIDFFAEIDRILSPGKHHYQKMYAALGTKEELLMSHMALVANLHALGILVIDEVQHLSRSDSTLLNFLVTLINRIGVPVMLIGTMDAADVLMEGLRIARRGVGMGSCFWERYAETDAECTSFVEDLWQYQWTTEQTELSDDLHKIIYQHSQGVIDLAVKLFMLAQMRAIRIGATGNRKERITVDLLEAVAMEEMALVAPLVKALRDRDQRAISKYKDLSSLTQVVTKMIQSDIGEIRMKLPGLRRTDAIADRCSPERTDDEKMFEKIFIELGVAVDVGNDLVAEARAKNKDATLFDIMDTLRAALCVPTTAKAKRRRKGKIDPAGFPQPEDDLRRIVSEGQEQGRTPYMSLLAAGMAGPASYLRAS